MSALVDAIEQEQRALTKAIERAERVLAQSGRVGGSAAGKYHYGDQSKDGIVSSLVTVSRADLQLLVNAAQARLTETPA